jgi:PKD repeat protein
LNDTTSAFGNITFLWNPGAYTTQSITVTPDTTTTYTVTATGASGCSSNSSVTVVVTATVANFGYSANGTTITFSDSSLNAAGYQWSFGDTGTSTLQNPVHVYAAPGTDTVTLVAISASCKNDTITRVITVYPVGINNVNNISGLSVWPNPATNVAHVSFTGEVTNAKLSIIDQLGQTVYSNNIAPVAGTQYQARY